MVAVAERGLAKRAMSEWTAYLSKEKAAPTMTTIRTFLLQKAEELDDGDTVTKTPVTSSKPHSTPPSRTYNPGRKMLRNPTFHTKEATSGCKLCEDAFHVLFQCPEFRNLTLEQRQSTTQRLKVCNNCLSNHQVKNCLSRRSCRTCGRRHHSLLHRGEPLMPGQADPPQSALQQQHQPAPPYQQRPTPHTSAIVTPPVTNVSTTDPTCNMASTSSAMILGTCVAMIESQGKLHKARALLDNGSCLTFITTKMVNTLKMKKISESTAVSGFPHHQANTR